MASANFSPVFPCAKCGKFFLRSRPDANRQVFCSLECRFKFYCKPVESGCIEWQSAIAKSGYGVLRINNKTVTAHRVSFFLAHGVWPVGLTRHSCDNRKCVNPLHLLEGSDSDNINDMMLRGRHAWFRWNETERAEWKTKILVGQRASRLSR